MISILNYASISPLGKTSDKIWEEYLKKSHCLNNTSGSYKGDISSTNLDVLEDLKNTDIKYKALDKSVLMAIYVSKMAFQQTKWNNNDTIGINIGSSRGATELFEGYYDDFKQSELGKTHPLTSPTTTLGNVATWIANDLQIQGPTISHSITCSTALHAILNGIAWLKSGMSDKFIVGASEAPNTPFTIAQMKALKIYTDRTDEYPVLALDFTKERNTMCLGEGAISFCLENGIHKGAAAYIESVGYATEILKHNISITDDAICFQKSMNMALENIDESIDAIVMHAPGTIKGDSSEYNAIKKIFGKKLPALTSNKWKIGHTLGTSGGLSMELAILMLQKQKFIEVPYIHSLGNPKKMERIMVNAVGFGGNAVSIVLTRNPQFI